MKRKFALMLTAMVLSTALSGCSDKPKAAPVPPEAVGVASKVAQDGKDYPDFRALEASLGEDPNLVIPREAVAMVGGADALRDSIPPDATFKVYDKTWEPDGVGGGTVKIDMLVPGQIPTETVAIMLEDVSQRWFILQTLPLDEVPGATEHGVQRS